MTKTIFLCLLFMNAVFSDEDARMRYQLRRGDGLADSRVAVDMAGLLRGAGDLTALSREEPFEEAAGSRDVFPKSDFKSLVETNLEEYQGNEDYLKQYPDEDGIFDEPPASHRSDRSLGRADVDQKGSPKYRDNAITQKNYNNVKKKCVFKNMKIPFFSHEQRKTTRPKTNRKRKLFNLTAKKLRSKSDKECSPPSPPTQRATDTTLFKLNKRSYLERICPICKRKFVRRAPGTEQTDEVHNSRQYFFRKSLNSNREVSEGYGQADKSAAPAQRDRASSDEATVRI